MGYIGPVAAQGRGLLSHQHTEAELCGILEQRVGPCGAPAVSVKSIGAGGGGIAPDRAAARGVCDIHAGAEQLGQQLYIGGFSAACAGAGKFHQRTQELTSFGSVRRELLGGLLAGQQRLAIIKNILAFVKGGIAEGGGRLCG